MEIVNLQDKRWVVKHKTPDVGVSPAKMEWYKWYRQADLVLKKNGTLYFVEEMPEIEFEDIPETA